MAAVDKHEGIQLFYRLVEEKLHGIHEGFAAVEHIVNEDHGFVLKIFFSEIDLRFKGPGIFLVYFDPAHFGFDRGDGVEQGCYFLRYFVTVAVDAYNEQFLFFEIVLIHLVGHAVELLIDLLRIQNFGFFHATKLDVWREKANGRCVPQIAGMAGIGAEAYGTQMTLIF